MAHLFCIFEHGADRQIRTADLILTKDALYRLSYISEFLLERVAGIEPASLAWKAKVLPLNYTRVPRSQVLWLLPTWLLRQRILPLS